MTGLEQTQAASSAWVTPTFVCLYKNLDAWWNSVPKRRKQKLDAEIRRQRKFAADWLVRHELFLPREDAGRDSTNIQPYK